jgi:glutamate synthase (NADPH/NADH) large chain
MVDLESVIDESDLDVLNGALVAHARHTGSKLAARILNDWEILLPSFVKVMPTEYKRVLQQRRAQRLAMPGRDDHGGDAPGMAAKGVSRG